jgi:hypothetical protein
MKGQEKAPIELRFKISPTGEDADLYEYFAAYDKRTVSSVAKTLLRELFLFRSLYRKFRELVVDRES